MKYVWGNRHPDQLGQTAKKWRFSKALARLSMPTLEATWSHACCSRCTRAAAAKAADRRTAGSCGRHPQCTCTSGTQSHRPRKQRGMNSGGLMAQRGGNAHTVWSAGAFRQVHSRVLNFGGVFASLIRSHFCAASVRSVLLENSQHEACELPLLLLREAGRDPREQRHVLQRSRACERRKGPAGAAWTRYCGLLCAKKSRLRRGCAVCRARDLIFRIRQ